MTTLTKLFIDLVSIPSPSGREKNVGKFISKYLKDHNIRSYFDKTGKINDSNSGNLIATLQGDSSSPAILIVTHIDTVEDGKNPIKAKITKGVIKSEGKTILGADNKASVACLLENLVEWKQIDNKPNIIAVFSTREEKGIMGASLLKLGTKIDCAFVIDGAAPLGSFAYKALGQAVFSLEILGKTAHSGIEPEKGINAINAAGLLLSKIKQGRIGKDTVNIGKIEGGQAVNIVADRAVLYGEVRSFLQKNINKHLSNIEKQAQIVCKKTGCSYKMIINNNAGAPPMSINQNHPINKIAAKAASLSNLKFNSIEASYTCEANYLSKMGYPVLNVCRGGKSPHSKEESIIVQELEQLKLLIKNLVKESTP